jgi:hypothetical protein
MVNVLEEHGLNYENEFENMRFIIEFYLKDSTSLEVCTSIRNSSFHRVFIEFSIISNRCSRSRWCCRRHSKAEKV